MFNNLDFTGFGQKRSDKACLAPVTIHLGQLRVLHKLGDGGFSDVFLVRDISDNQEHALKLIKPACGICRNEAVDPDLLFKALQDAHAEDQCFSVLHTLPLRSAPRINGRSHAAHAPTHPQRIIRRTARVVMHMPVQYEDVICTFQREFGLAEGGVAEPVLVGCILPVAACSLADVMESASLRATRSPKMFESWLRAVLVVAAEGHAIAKELHGAGIMHRDLKPSNFLLYPGLEDITLSIADFGLSARAPGADGTCPLLVRSVAVGSPGYLPLSLGPLFLSENSLIAQGKTTSSPLPRTADWHGLGAMLTQMVGLSTHFPFNDALRDELVAVFAAARAQQPEVMFIEVFMAHMAAHPHAHRDARKALLQAPCVRQLTGGSPTAQRLLNTLQHFISLACGDVAGDTPLPAASRNKLSFRISTRKSSSKACGTSRGAAGGIGCGGDDAGSVAAAKALSAQLDVVLAHGLTPEDWHVGRSELTAYAVEGREHAQYQQRLVAKQQRPINTIPKTIPAAKAPQILPVPVPVSPLLHKHANADCSSRALQSQQALDADGGSTLKLGKHADGTAPAAYAAHGAAAPTMEMPDKTMDVRTVGTETVALALLPAAPPTCPIPMDEAPVVAVETPAVAAAAAKTEAVYGHRSLSPECQLPTAPPPFGTIHQHEQAMQMHSKVPTDLLHSPTSRVTAAVVTNPQQQQQPAVHADRASAPARMTLTHLDISRPSVMACGQPLPAAVGAALMGWAVQPLPRHAATAHVHVMQEELVMVHGAGDVRMGRVIHGAGDTQGAGGQQQQQWISGSGWLQQRRITSGDAWAGAAGLAGADAHADEHASMHSACEQQEWHTERATDRAMVRPSMRTTTYSRITPASMRASHCGSVADGTSSRSGWSSLLTSISMHLRRSRVTRGSRPSQGFLGMGVDERGSAFSMDITTALRPAPRTRHVDAGGSGAGLGSGGGVAPRRSAGRGADAYSAPYLHVGERMSAPAAAPHAYHAVAAAAAYGADLPLQLPERCSDPLGQRKRMHARRPYALQANDPSHEDGMHCRMDWPAPEDTCLQPIGPLPPLAPERPTLPPARTHTKLSMRALLRRVSSLRRALGRGKSKGDCPQRLVHAAAAAAALPARAVCGTTAAAAADPKSVGDSGSKSIRRFSRGLHKDAAADKGQQQQQQQQQLGGGMHAAPAPLRAAALSSGLSVISSVPSGALHTIHTAAPVHAKPRTLLPHLQALLACMRGPAVNGDMQY